MLLVLGPALVGVALWKRATAKAAASSITLGGLATLMFLFIMPTQAFLPGITISALSFFGVSLVTAHSSTENTDPGVIWGE